MTTSSATSGSPTPGVKDARQVYSWGSLQSRPLPAFFCSFHRVSLKRPRSVKGVVRDPNGLVVPSANVLVHSVDTGDCASGVQLAMGTSRLSPVFR
jgi:hypothetical protein